MLPIDAAAHSSRWRRRHPVDKAVLGLGLTVLAISLPPWPGAALVLVTALVVLLGPAGVPGTAAVAGLPGAAGLLRDRRGHAARPGRRTSRRRGRRTGRVRVPRRRRSAAGRGVAAAYLGRLPRRPPVRLHHPHVRPAAPPGPGGGARAGRGRRPGDVPHELSAPGLRTPDPGGPGRPARPHHPGRHLAFPGRTRRHRVRPGLRPGHPAPGRTRGPRIRRHPACPGARGPRLRPLHGRELRAPRHGGRPHPRTGKALP